MNGSTPAASSSACPLGVPRRAPDRVAAVDQLGRECQAAAATADDQAARHRPRGSALGAAPTAELPLDVRPRPLRQAASAAASVGRLEQLGEVAIGQILLASPALLVEV